MALGIPGDTATAIMMGGLLIHGLRCGPMLFVNNMPTVYGIFAALLIANCAMVVFQTDVYKRQVPFCEKVVGFWLATGQNSWYIVVESDQILAKDE